MFNHNKQKLLCILFCIAHLLTALLPLRNVKIGNSPYFDQLAVICFEQLFAVRSLYRAPTETKQRQANVLALSLLCVCLCAVQTSWKLTVRAQNTKPIYQNYQRQYTFLQFRDFIIFVFLIISVLPFCFLSCKLKTVHKFLLNNFWSFTPNSFILFAKLKHKKNITPNKENIFAINFRWRAISFNEVFQL